MINDIINNNPEPGWLGKLHVGDLIFIKSYNKVFKIAYHKIRGRYCDFDIILSDYRLGCDQTQCWSLTIDGTWNGIVHVLPIINSNELFVISNRK